jgi:hypothetical protein
MGGIIMLKMKLQFFADPDTGTTVAGTTTDTTDTTKATDTTDTTDTKDDAKDTTSTTVDAKAEAQKIADAMVAKKLKGMPTKEELKAFKDWQESQKTEEQKTNEKVTAAEKEKQDALTEANTLKATVACLKQGVASDNVDDVVVLAQRLISDDVTIDDAIKQVVKKYPQFASTATTETKPNVTTGSQTTQTTTTDDKALRKAFGLD